MLRQHDRGLARCRQQAERKAPHLQGLDVVRPLPVDHAHHPELAIRIAFQDAQRCLALLNAQAAGDGAALRAGRRAGAHEVGFVIPEERGAENLDIGELGDLDRLGRLRGLRAQRARRAGQGERSGQQCDGCFHGAPFGSKALIRPRLVFVCGPKPVASARRSQVRPHSGCGRKPRHGVACGGRTSCSQSWHNSLKWL